VLGTAGAEPAADSTHTTGLSQLPQPQLLEVCCVPHSSSVHVLLCLALRAIATACCQKLAHDLLQQALACSACLSGCGFGT
jgi:hypothetical protein